MGPHRAVFEVGQYKVGRCGGGKEVLCCLYIISPMFVHAYFDAIDFTRLLSPLRLMIR
jgi:hypothetical protein